MVGRVKLKHHNLYERKIQPTFNPSQASPSVHNVNEKVAELFRIISNIFLKDKVGKHIFFSFLHRVFFCFAVSRCKSLWIDKAIRQSGDMTDDAKSLDNSEDGRDKAIRDVMCL